MHDITNEHSGEKMEYTSIEDLEERHVRESYALVGEVLPWLAEELRRRGGSEHAITLAFGYVVKTYEKNFLGPQRQTPMELAHEILALAK